MTLKERKESIETELNKLEKEKAHALKTRDELYKWLTTHVTRHPNWEENVKDWQYHANKFNFLTNKIYKITHHQKTEVRETVTMPKRNVKIFN